MIDEVHTLIGAGAAEGAIDAANISSLPSPAVSCGIGATTLDEYRKRIERDAALERRFQPVNVGERPSTTPSRVRGLRERYETPPPQDHRRRPCGNCNLGDRYISDRFCPTRPST